MTENSTASDNGVPMSRRERKKLETRMAILDAAFDLMTTNGYDGVTVEDIAARADVASATFFLHFPTKASLIIAFNQKISAKVADQLDGKQSSAQEKLDRIRTLVQDEWRQHAELLRKLVIEDAEQHRGELIAASGSLAELVRDIVREGQESGEFSGDFSADLIARSIIAAWRATAQEWARSGDTERARKEHRQVLELILKGALPR